jgi:glycosyltransferase involved in cell wall biosynthesis
MPWHISERGGGAEVQAAFLAGELVKKGFIVAYVCQTIQKDRIETTTQNDGYTIHWLKPSGRFPWIDQNKYKKKLATIHPNLIVQRMSSNVTYVLGKYAKKNRIKFVWICTDNLCPSRNFFVENFKIKYPFKPSNALTYLVFLLNAMIMDGIRNKGMKKVNIAFTQNEQQKQWVKNNFFLDSNKMISGHPRPEIITTAKVKFKQKKILWAANMGKNKRPELFIELARLFEHSDYIFVMVGGHADKNYKKELLTNKSSNLIVTGQLSFEESLKYFDNTSLFVNTSFSEGFSNTYIQSWLRGIPTIVFGADPDGVIYKNNLGYVVSNMKEAKQKITHLFENKELFCTVSNKCLDFSNKNHSVEVMTENFLKIIQDEGITLH